ncbi:MAG: YidC/Oxa1 family membrane protein insertase [Candidatus Eremiobacteraeota bacterium]|nr:YidC/Oxa1 family membrane protein insertase [Candidatus Eremiobacteraeota bacterium]
MHFLDPLVHAISYIVNVINIPVHNLGWSLIIFAGLVRLAFWPLNTMQFKTMVGMQKIGPQIKKLQAKYKANPDPQKMQQEQMALYKQANVNPMAGCLPLLVQMPIIISVFYVVKNNLPTYTHEKWGWIGTQFSFDHAKILATSLAASDIALLAFYIVTMYISVRYTSMPATDPQQAQTQKLMAIMSPAMLAFFGFKAQWPSAMILYWIALNVFTMAQQFYLLRKYHQPLSILDSEHSITGDATVEPAPAALPKATTNGSSSRRNRKRTRR